MRRPLFPLSFLLFWILFWPLEGGTFGSEAVKGEEQSLMGLANHFFRQGEYFRAITEYKRFIYHFSKSPRAEEAHFKIGKAFFLGGRYEDAVSSLKMTIQLFPEGAHRFKARYLMGRCWIDLGKLKEARRAFLDVVLSAPTRKLRAMARSWLAQSYIKEERWEEAIEVLEGTHPESPFRKEAERYASALKGMERLPQRSPETAAFLAAMMPGAGHLYSDRPKDALVSFLLNATFAAGAIEAFHKDQKVLGGILALIEIGLYAGNIFSAVSSAHKFNREQKKRYLDRIQIRVGSTADQKGGLAILRFSF